ncbi:MAG: damage-inducible protein DinB [Rhodospirillaceae bacterium]|nr:damage-inducible protein DinB [Rhodospirillaceae bacterium]
MLDYFLTLARYNEWANRQIYGAVGKLDAAAIAAPRTGFFPSLLKTLNHIVVADRIWLGRLTAQPETGLTALDQMLHPDFADLTHARADLDQRILAFVRALDPARLAETLEYRTVAGDPHATPIPLVLGHMFNHQTHHRGQAHAMLSGTEVAPPVLDIIYFLRAEKAR